MAHNKEIEERENTEKVELPGGENVRLGYSRGISLDYGARKADFHYSADFPAAEVDKALEKIQTYIDSKIVAAVNKELP